MNWLQRKLFWVKTGKSIEMVNDGNPVEEYVIRFKDIFINVLIDENGQPVSLSWANDGTMLPTPIREFWTATPPNKENK